ncbi:hypothetical protein FB45DRAFT_1018399 [Roridomyces roridus]|uniref:Cyclin N-terminal domain-containing protein n=1 Tax=Roridomyces roridus TaxID=1738132 RepID=A0AAD7FZ77_9AGAR|nr:hypothetical protein FB45DRAFT_1018399 [Roridomyces roridus]
MHSPELLELLDIQLSHPVLEYIVDCVSHTVDHAFGRPPRRTRSRRFTSFVGTVLSRAEIPTPTVLVALHYMARARPHLTIAVPQYALERVFLGALVCAAKYTNDSTLKNIHWGMCTGVFGAGDIGRIEREFLEVLDWELGVTEEDLLRYHKGLVRAVLRAEEEEGFVLLTNSAPLHRRRPSMSAEFVVLPELEPSSPQSSIGSLSPPTPISHSTSGSPLPRKPQTHGYKFLHPFFHGHSAYVE